MAEAKIEDMELGNLLMGNSRGPFKFPDRMICDSKEWQELMELLQAEDYHASFNRKKKLLPFTYTDDGGIVIKDEDKVIFEIHPYWWDDCTCGAEIHNENLEETLLKKYFTKEEQLLLLKYDKFCKEDCPAQSWLEVNQEKTSEELDKLCTCGRREENRKLQEEKAKLSDKVEKYNKEFQKKCKGHKSDCMLCIHNFIWHPNQEDEFWIDWYKYPFRDSYMNKDISKEEILKIFHTCYLIANAYLIKKA